jgi:hypothetical protein
LFASHIKTLRRMSRSLTCVAQRGGGNPSSGSVHRLEPESLHALRTGWARIAARATVVGSVTDVQPVVTGLTRTMEKIYHPRGIAIDESKPGSGLGLSIVLELAALYGGG